jgi:multidrug efflux pump subunit AcrA (membrane-fusion protein)
VLCDTVKDDLMRFMLRALSGLFFLALTVGLVVVAGVTVKSAIDERLSRESRPPEARERIFAAEVIELVPGTIVPELNAFGTVEARRSLELRAPSGGRIVALSESFEDGGSVVAGEVLVRLDPADAEAGLALARAALDEARAAEAEAGRAADLAAEDLAVAERQSALREQALERQTEIAGRGLATASDLEAAELAAASAAASVLSRRQAQAQAQARRDSAAIAVARQSINLAEAERRLAETEIRAGFSGALSGVTAVEGGLVTPNERLGVLIDPGALEVSFRVSTSQFTRLIDAGGRLLPAAVSVALEVLGTEIEATGRLARVGAAVGEGQTGRLVHAALDAAPGFMPGDFVSVRIAEPPLEGVARVPVSALGTGSTVLLLGPEDRLEEATVEILRRQGEDVVITVSSLAGREIVAERTQLLGSGIKIRPLRANLEAGASAGEGRAADAPTSADGGDLVEIDPERRARLIAFVEASTEMPAEAKARILSQLQQDRVPARILERIEARMGG